jgi:hypothetical protein
MTRDHPSFCLPDGPPARRTSELPPGGTLRLELILGDKLGSGAEGLVYAVDNAVLLTPAGDDAPHSLPPIVVKVCYGERGRQLLLEASAYDEMECIQGVVVPRCFGYFEVEADDITVPILCQDVNKWLLEADQKEERQEEEELLMKGESHSHDEPFDEDGSDKSWEDDEPFEDDEDLQDEDYLEDKPDRDFSRRLCVLVLERVGQPIPFPSDLIKDLKKWDVGCVMHIPRKIR